MAKVSRDELLNGWLKYYNTTVEEVVKTHPKEILASSDWFKLYPVTQYQQDEWVRWAKDLIKKRMRCSKRMVENSWWLVYLECAPNVKRDE